jgi:radical SAM superfamily enzyme YgiQ (UPF0313 family)
MPMKIALVCVEDGIVSVGFRKIAAYVKSLNADTTVYYVSEGKYRSLRAMIAGRQGQGSDLRGEDVRAIAAPLARADLVGFSSMTGYAGLTERLIRQVRALNPGTFVVWGGIHPIIVPEAAIQHADAICTGEGEFAFAEFLEAFRAGKDHTGTRNFWFNQDGQVRRNGFRPLMTGEEMSALPLPHYGGEEFIYAPGRGFERMTTRHYVRQNGLSYSTVWSIGCPFHCTYCGNTRFIENDEGYRRIRHPGVPHLIAEIEQAIRVHPHIATVVFQDDSFMALPLAVLAEFAAEYRKRIDLPFSVQGVIPSYVRRDKLEILLAAGLNRVRMGIQNGSQRILEFYERKTPPARIEAAAALLAEYRRYMIPPAYDVILDNPIETREDVATNLEFLNRLARPFTLNVFSLRSIPNTVLEKRMAERGISLDEISANYVQNVPTLANCMVYLLAIGRVPRWLFEPLARRALPMTAPQPKYRRLLMLLRTLYLTVRGLSHMRFLDFSVITGRTGYFLWRIGIIDFWNRRMVPRFKAP